MKKYQYIKEKNKKDEDMKVIKESSDDFEIGDELQLDDGMVVTVSEVGDNYIIVVDENDEEYEIKLSDEDDEDEDDMDESCGSGKKKKKKMSEEDETEVYGIELDWDTFEQLEVGDEIELEDGTMLAITGVNDDIIFALDDEDNEYELYPPEE